MLPKWYSYLVPNSAVKNPDPNRQALMDYEKLEENSFIACQHIRFPKFAIFSSYLHFTEYIFSGIIPDRHMCFYEIIYGSSRQKPYFDIDINLETDNITTEDVICGIGLLLKHILVILPMASLDDIMVFSSHSDKKMSYHIIVDRWCFSNHEVNREFYNRVTTSFDHPLRHYIDSRVYSVKQQMRVYGSRKYGTERVKNFDLRSTWKRKIEGDDREIFLHTFGGSLISHTSECKLII